MPIMRRNLTRADRAEHLARAKRMRADGVDIQIRTEWLESSRPLDIVVAGPPASLVCDLPSARVGYVILVRLVARWRVSLLDCQITTEYDDQIVLESFDERTPLCRFGWLEYPRNQVLNQRLERSLRFHGRNQMVEGVILASGLKPVPELYHHNTFLPFELTFWDQSENEIRHESTLFVDRTCRPKRTVVRPKSSLCGPPKTHENEPVVACGSSVRAIPRLDAKFRMDDGQGGN